jgi:four helix bundle protein
MKDFRDLLTWRKSHILTLAIYNATTQFPKTEIYGLTSQMRRASASIPANIAEGCGKEGDADFGRYIQIAMGSASELDYHLILSHDLGLLPDSDYQNLNEQTQEVKRMLVGLLKKLKANRS